MSSHGDPSAVGLRRDLGLFDAVGIGLGAIIGAGLFVVTGVAANVAGPSLLIGLLIAGFAATCNALSSAELAATYPRSGGTYEYGYELLSPTCGFTAGWMFLVSKIAAGGAVALGFGGYVNQLIPNFSAWSIAIIAVIFLTFANLFGIKKAGVINNAIVFVTLSSLLYFIATGLPHFKVENLKPFAPFGVGGVLEASALLFFAYTGYARLATLGEEVNEPKKTIPRAIILSLGIAILFYLSVSVVALGAIGGPSMGESSSPLFRAAESFATKSTRGVVTLGAASAMLGVLLSQILGISRMMLAMARRSDLPPFLNHVSDNAQVPDRGILLCGVIILLLTLVGTLKWIVSIATFTIFIYYSITNLAALKLNPKDKLYPKAVAYLGFAFCILLAFSIQFKVLLSGLAALIVGFAFRTLLVNPLRGDTH